MGAMFYDLLEERARLLANPDASYYIDMEACTKY